MVVLYGKIYSYGEVTKSGGPWPPAPHSYVYLLYRAEKPSVCLTVMLISQPCLQQLKWDLLEMKAESSGISKYIFISLCA